MSEGYLLHKKARRNLEKIVADLLISDREVHREELEFFTPEHLEIAIIYDPETTNQKKFNAIIDDILMTIGYDLQSE